jgi:hypothetical protein
VLLDIGTNLIIDHEQVGATSFYYRVMTSKLSLAGKWREK